VGIGDGRKVCTPNVYLSEERGEKCRTVLEGTKVNKVEMYNRDGKREGRNTGKILSQIVTDTRSGNSSWAQAVYGRTRKHEKKDELSEAARLRRKKMR